MAGPRIVFHDKPPDLPWIPTRSGERVCLQEPDYRTINIEDIACALSRIPRFNGHTTDHYSVAQHSILVSRYLGLHESPLLALAGLLHDGHEAYFGDITSPVKDLLASQYLHAITRRMDEAIGQKFNIDAELFRHPLVKEADLDLLATETRDLMPGHKIIYCNPGKAWAGVKIVPWSIAEAEERFLQQFKDELGQCQAIREKGTSSGSAR